MLMLLLPLALAGCTIFAPRYNAALDTNVTAAAEDVATIAANVDLGTYATAASFTGASDTYVDAIAKLSVAEQQAGNLTVQGKIATRERENLGKIIASCATEVKTLAGIHQTSGVAPAAGLTAAMTVACNRAVRAVQAQKQ